MALTLRHDSPRVIGRGVGAGVALVGVWLLLAAEHVGILRSLGWVYTDEDQAVLWLGAVDFAHLRFYEPRFYGQAYNSMFESLLAVPFVWWGAPVWKAVPLASILVSLAAWTALAGLAAKQRQPLTAVTILALPLLIDQRFLLVSTMPRGFMPGIFLSVIAATLWLDRPDGRFRTFGALFLLGCACSLNPNALLVAVPFGAAVFSRVWKDSSGRLQIGLGILGACVVHGAVLLFYVRHPSYVTHPSPSLSISWQHWLSSWQSLNELVGAFLPLDASRAVLLMIAVGTIVVLGRGAMIRGGQVFLLTLATLLVCALAVDKVAEGSPDRLFLPRARVFLGLPFSVSLLLLSIRSRPGMVASVMCIVMLAGATLSFAERRHARTAYVEAAVAQSVAAHPWLRPWRVHEVLERCDLLRAAARTSGLRLCLHWRENLPAYACTALADGEFLGLFPTFERRRWLVDELKSQSLDRLMMADVTSEECNRLDALGWKCRPLAQNGEPGQIVELRFRPQTLSSAARFLVNFYGGEPEDW
jgi:hypothetical protein